ncbi:nitroreductase family protein [Gracilimonas sp. Q87]|uniref:nitroreductase family protein n=1 Tax=Gracilimonas sp. Q87 TaxID=3384766 RepID=UPI00398440C1
MTTDETIRVRKTLKLRADPENPLPVTKGEGFKDTINELIELAGKAPFHHESPEKQRSETLKGSEPWRFHALDGKGCRTLLNKLIDEKPVKSSDGIKEMLAASDTLILGTWIPEKSRKKGRKYHPNVKNMEHIAATGAAIQNLLLAATACDINAYWSSGGCLRKPKLLKYLGIPKHEILLGAIFIFPNEYPESVQTKIGKNVTNRGGLGDYMDWVEPE